MVLAKGFKAGAAIAPYRIVKFSAADTVIQSTAAADSHVGVVSEVGPANGERTEVHVYGAVLVEAGAAVSLGALVTADSVGRGIAAAPAAGANARHIGIALEAASAAGDVIRVLLSQGSVQG